MAEKDACGRSTEPCGLRHQIVGLRPQPIAMHCSPRGCRPRGLGARLSRATNSGVDARSSLYVPPVTSRSWVGARGWGTGAGESGSSFGAQAAARCCGWAHARAFLFDGCGAARLPRRVCAAGWGSASYDAPRRLRPASAAWSAAALRSRVARCSGCSRGVVCRLGG